MPISVSYQPSAASIAGAAYQGGLGIYDERRRQEELQRQLEADRLKNSRYQTDMDAALRTYLQQVQNSQAETSQLRGFQQQQSLSQQQIADLQKRQQQDIANQQQMQQAGFGQQTKLQSNEIANQRAMQEAGFGQQAALQNQSIAAQMQQLQLQIQDAQARQQYALAAERMNQMAQLQAQAQRQQAEFGQQQQLAGFGLYGNLMQNAQQAGLQSGLSRQQFGQQSSLMGQSNQYQTAQQDQQFQQQNFLGQYSPYYSQLSARQVEQQDQQYARQQQALEQAYQRGDISQATYSRALNEVTANRAGIRQQLGTKEDLRQAAFNESIFQMPVPGGGQIPVFKDQNGQIHPIEDPTARFADSARKIQADRAANELQLRAKAVEMAIQKATLTGEDGQGNKTSQFDPNLMMSVFPQIMALLTGKTVGAGSAGAGLVAQAF